MTSPAAVSMDVDSERPTKLLPLAQLLRLSVYWLGLIAVINGIGVILQERIKTLVPDPTIQYTTLGVIQAAGRHRRRPGPADRGLDQRLHDQPVRPAQAVHPHRDAAGRRVPRSGSRRRTRVLAVGAFVVLLQFSANFAQGPFQGYVPDLVPAAQVGLASGLVGLFTVLGVVVGTGLASIGIDSGDFTIPTIALGVIELVTMLSLFFRLDEGRAAKDRQGKSWPTVAMEAWGRDILQERSFIFLVASRFFILGGGYFLIGLMVPYLERALGIIDPDERAGLLFTATLIVAICTAIATIPAAKIADRYGRKRVIYVACLIAGIGMTIAALAPSAPVFIGGAILMGVGLGSFLAVDWALMTEVIPKASSGRYMGISNVATATNGVVSAFIGGVFVDLLVRAGAPTLGPRVAFLLAPLWFLIGALLLRPVVEPPRFADRADTATG